MGGMISRSCVHMSDGEEEEEDDCNAVERMAFSNFELRTMASGRKIRNRASAAFEPHSAD
jgi:hypothetical protein